MLCCSASNAEANNSPSALPKHLLQAPACAAWDWRSLLAMEVPGAHLLWSGLPMRLGTLAVLQQVPVCATSKCTLIACIHAMLHICVNTHLISIQLCMHACMHACMHYTHVYARTYHRTTHMPQQSPACSHSTHTCTPGLMCNCLCHNQRNNPQDSPTSRALRC